MRAIPGPRRTRCDCAVTRWARSLGLLVHHQQDHHRQDMTGLDLARYVAERLAAAGPIGKHAGRALADARAGARLWANEPAPSAVLQRWVEILATPDRWYTRWRCGLCSGPRSKAAPRPLRSPHLRSSFDENAGPSGGQELPFPQLNAVYRRESAVA